MYAWQKAVLFWLVQSSMIFCSVIRRVHTDLNPCRRLHLYPSPPQVLPLSCLMICTFTFLPYPWPCTVPCLIKLSQLLTLTGLCISQQFLDLVSTFTLCKQFCKQFLYWSQLYEVLSGRHLSKAFIWAVYDLSYTPVKLIPVIQKCTPKRVL